MRCSSIVRGRIFSRIAKIFAAALRRQLVRHRSVGRNGDGLQDTGNAERRTSNAAYRLPPATGRGFNSVDCRLPVSVTPSVMNDNPPFAR